MARKTTNRTTTKTIEEKYKSMSDIEHVLFRPGMYVGSTKCEEQNGFIYNIDTARMEMCEYKIVPAMLKIVDEIISNSCDEYRRVDNLGLTEINVKINKQENCVIVQDNGGISVVKHKDADCWLPEFIFGRLRTSSNYNDDEDRSGVGTNGVGSSISNIFSNKFIIETCDGKKHYKRSWSNNMSVLNDDLEITKANKNEHGTTTTMYIDMSRFGIKKIDDDFCNAVLTLCVNAAAANSGLTITYSDDDIDDSDSVSTNNSLSFKFSSLKEYAVLLYNIDENSSILYSDSDKEVLVVPDDNINVGFVNGALCSHGTHIRELRSEINESLSYVLKRKHKVVVTSRQCDNGYSLFVSCNVSNPSYDSQTKDTLTTPVSKFYTDTSKSFSLPDNIIKKCVSSEIINNILDWYKQKENAEEQKTLRKINREAQKGLKRPDKFIDCASKKAEERQLWIFEGDSAKAAFRSCRNPRTQAGLIMRGVPKGAYNVKATELMKNEVYNDIIKVTGLKFGTEYNKKDLKFSKIVISSDMDNDGHHIAGILGQFFSNWSELFEDGIIVRSISPIIVAKKGNISKKYYNIKDYKKDENKLKGYVVKFAKGLGGLNMEESKEMYLNPHFEKYTLDDFAPETFELWFSDDTERRKKALAQN